MLRSKIQYNTIPLGSGEDSNLGPDGLELLGPVAQGEVIFKRGLVWNFVTSRFPDFGKMNYKSNLSCPNSGEILDFGADFGGYIEKAIFLLIIEIWDLLNINWCHVMQIIYIWCL